MDHIRVGTCGYQYYNPGDGWKEEYESKLAAYADAFPVGELNRTFYRLPQVSTAERWREEADDEFEFSVKAWQAITHPWSSPTWNSHRETIPEEDTEDVGYFQPTAVVHDALTATLDRAHALDAEFVLFQTPPSFDCCDEHEANLRETLSAVDRDGVMFGWEPRGDWADHPDRIRRICDDLDLVHVVDVMRAESVSEHPVQYTRLHGLNDESYEYDYEYSGAELDTLAEKLRDATSRHQQVYCLFNNFNMYEDARSLLTRLYE